ncbi:MAG: helix-turn-helix domain-containing protein [Rhizobiales bacterium]|nr:helix-turn-helix domain-containing protein [Hyphomicrobiales bacterium]
MTDRPAAGQGTRPPLQGRRIARRPGIGVALRVLQQRALHISGVFVEQPGISLVRRGEKRVAVGDFDALIREGEAVALPAGATLEVTNVADASGLYEALSLVPDPALLDATANGSALRAPVHIGPLRSDFSDAVVRAIAAIDAPDTVPEAVAALRMREVLAWLGEAGVVFAAPRPTSAMLRVRMLVSEEPARPWSGPEVAQALAMSEATLRRRLAAEGTSLSALLVEVRMATALVMLQASDRPVAEIALDVGYGSPSRFASRFRARYGHPPHAVRDGDPDFDRRGTENDRPGSALTLAR